MMTKNLVVHNVEEDIVLALNERAAVRGRSAESEHREILRSALQRPKRRTFTEVLADMPNVGLDSDFDICSGQD